MKVYSRNFDNISGFQTNIGYADVRLSSSHSTGQTGIPKSFADLWRIGHTFSGFYSVIGEEKVESVYCDFTKLPTDSGPLTV